MTDIVALGEVLIDFTECGRSSDGMKIFEQNPGGAPANMLTAASHMGCSTAFIGKVGDDMHGHFLADTLSREGIDTSGIIIDKTCFTTLAFVGLDENGERSFSFSRKPGADTMLRPEEVRSNLLSSCRVFHFGSLSLTDEPARSATFYAVDIARKGGAVISYDPNFRAALWPDEETAVSRMKEMLPLADMVKVSDEESLLLTGCTSYEEAADSILSMGPSFVAVTLGSRGVLISRKGTKEYIDAFKTESVDTTGAGDSFWGGFMSSFLSLKVPVDDASWEDLKKCAVTGSAVAALCVQKRGGMPSIPLKEDVVSLLSKEEYVLK